MAGVGQGTVQAPEGAHIALGVLGDRLGKVAALGRDGADDGDGAFPALQCFDVPGPLVEFRQTGGQIGGETLLGGHFLQPAGDFPQRLRPAGGGVGHQRHMVAHIAVILRNGHAGID